MGLIKKQTLESKGAAKPSDLEMLTTPAPSLTEKDIKRNQIVFCFEAAFEWFIVLLSTDVFFATLLKGIGATDAQTGIISQLASLTLSVQLVSIFRQRRKGLKKWLNSMLFIYNMVFVFLYCIPIFNIPQNIKLSLFVVLFIGNMLLKNLAAPYKLPWLMSFVPDHKRGIFTGIKEATSYLGGVTFTFIMGTVVDYCNANAESAALMENLAKADEWKNRGFIICAVTMLVLGLCHAISIFMIKDRDIKDIEEAPTESGIGFADAVKRICSNKILLKLVVINILWGISQGLSVAFYGVYKINDLGFTLQYSAMITVASLVPRLIFSFVFGYLADKYSFTTILIVCYGISAFATGINIFTNPSNGHVLFMIYTIIFIIASCGQESGLWNIYFTYLPPEELSAAMGFKNCVSGLFNFIATLIGGIVLDHIQKAGNMFLGFHVYGQQVLTAIAFLFMIVAIFYLVFVIRPLKKTYR